MEINTDRQIKSYFLGTLAAAEAERLEEELAADAELTEQAQIVETELTDDYLRGVLSADERRLYEENYLTTRARREKLRLAENLWKVADENRRIADAPAPSFWQTLFADYRILTIGGLAAAIIFGGFVIVWLNVNKNSEIAEQENANQTPNSEVRNQLVETIKNFNAVNRNSDVGVKNSDNNTNPAAYNSQKNGSVNLLKSNAAPEIKPTPKPIAPPAPTLATFTLLPGTLRGEGEQFIKIAPNAGKINLRLTLPKDAAKYQTYRIVVQTADSETISTVTNLKSPNFALPAAELENRTYMIFLEGKNAENPAEPVAEYAFRVRR